MIEEIDPIKALDFIRDNADAFAKAKAERIYIENYLKSIKSIIMSKIMPVNGKEVALGTKEMMAYSDPDYLKQLEILKQAVAQEEKLKYLLEGAKLKVEVYKVQEYTKRTELRNLNVS